MIYLIIGHRGTGKTSWLKKIKKLFKSKVILLDLDTEIIKRDASWKANICWNKNVPPVNRWFLKSQTQFRRIERKVLMDLIHQYQPQKQDTFIAVGAGAKINPKGCHVLHLIRETDSDGRVFLDRPRLNLKLSPYEESLLLYSKREKYYQQVRDESFILPEQDISFTEPEKLFFGLKKGQLGASITLNKNTLPKDPNKWPTFINKRLKWGLRFFEFRNDEWSLASLRTGAGKNLLNLIPKKKQLFSFRPQRGSLRRDSVALMLQFCKLCLPNVSSDSPLPRPQRGSLRRDSVAPMLQLCKACESSYLKSLLKTSSALNVKRLQDRFAAKRMSELLSKLFKQEDKYLSCCKLYLPNVFFLLKKLSITTWDWMIEKGPPPAVPPILSAHHRNGKNLRQICKKFLKYKADHYKLAIPIKNLKELLEGHLWFLKDPSHRSFLPTSLKQATDDSFSWRWYRQIFGPKMHLNFIRESRGQGLKDQAFLSEVTERRKTTSHLKFGAVLGLPVSHSASPGFYRKLFAKNKMIFTKIPLTEKEFTKDHLYILQKMGLVFAAVTSPLKKKAWMICDQMDTNARRFQSVNTLIFKNKKWFGSNTDLFGVKTLLTAAGLGKTFHPEQIVVWGGGGTRAVLKHLVPLATFYSARSKQKIFGKKQNIRPTVIIWAVGRSRMSDKMFPFVKWRPRTVIDLNYTADSPGKEYAMRTGAKYICGTRMFQAQAKKQEELLLKHKFMIL